MRLFTTHGSHYKNRFGGKRHENCHTEVTLCYMDYTRRELMVVAAAREIHDGEKVFVGMRLPLLGFAVAKELHAPNAAGTFENGVIRDWPALQPIFTISDPPNLARALYCGSVVNVMSLLQ